jgi:hypothetical protein
MESELRDIASLELELLLIYNIVDIIWFAKEIKLKWNFEHQSPKTNGRATSYYKASTESELRDTASIELKLLLVSSFNVLPLDSSAEISTKSITRGSWFWTHNKGGLQISDAKVSTNISAYNGN